MTNSQAGLHGLRTATAHAPAPLGLREALGASSVSFVARRQPQGAETVQTHWPVSRAVRRSLGRPGPPRVKGSLRGVRPRRGPPHLCRPRPTEPNMSGCPRESRQQPWKKGDQLPSRPLPKQTPHRPRSVTALQGRPVPQQTALQTVLSQAAWSH